jgi:RNA polymerase sigma-70 factor, ECF subfamily
MNGNDVNELVRRAQAGETQAFETLMRTYDRQILSLAYQMLGNSMDAEDVTQEVFMRAYRRLSDFRFESEFFTWLYRIAVNCSISARRRRLRNRHVSIDRSETAADSFERRLKDSGHEPDKQMIQQEIRETVEKHLDKLPIMQRAVFILRFLEDFKIKEIAEITGSSEGAVKNSLFRSTRKMRKYLAHLIRS